MTFATLDMIVRRSLLEKNLPIHWYAEFLFHQSACIRELAKRTLKIINTVSLPIDDYGAVNLPDDFVEDIAVCFNVGGYLQPLPHREDLNPLRLIDSSGQFIPYALQTQSDTNLAIENNWFFGSSGWMWYWNVNDYGEPTGRFFGANGGTQIGYKVIRERRQIQLTEGITGGVVLQYIGNGQSINNATQVDWEAFRCIQTYSDWQRSPNATNNNSPEARTYYNEERLLRANKSGLTLEDIKNVVRLSFTAAMKN